LKNNAADIEDFEFSDLGSEIKADEESSVTLGFD